MMDETQLTAWFAAQHKLLEDAYTAATQPWQQSGVGLHTPRTAADWAALRRPIAEAIPSSGTWLDIGCANGYLIECVLEWVLPRGIVVDPYGLDISPKLLEMARARLPLYADHLFLGNAWDWQPPRRFDCVNTALEYVPDHLRTPYIQRLLTDFLVPRGTLLVAEYASQADPRPHLTIDATLIEMGFTVAAIHTGGLANKEMTRVATIIAA